MITPARSLTPEPYHGSTTPYNRSPGNNEAMGKLLNSLQTKLTLSFVVIIVLISGLTFLYTYGETKNALKQSVRAELSSVAGILATQVDAEKVLSLRLGDDGSQAYIEVVTRLQTLRSRDPKLLNAYIMKFEGDRLSFLVDDLYPEADAAKVGEGYESDDMPVIVEAEQASTASREFYTDKWGTFLSGYAPIKNAAGETVAILGVDMDASEVVARQEFIGNTIYVVVGVSILVAGGIIAAFSRTIIRDINLLNEGAEKISMGDTDVTINVRRSDEIGDLADSFSRMVASLKILMATDQPMPPMGDDD